MKTSELTGVALDWAVAKCEGFFEQKSRNNLPVGKVVPGSVWFAPHVNAWRLNDYVRYQPSTNWEQGGRIIEREGIELRRGNPLYFPKGNESGDHYEPLWLTGSMQGSTHLIAAMRAYVSSKLGYEIEIPEELK